MNHYAGHFRGAALTCSLGGGCRSRNSEGANLLTQDMKPPTGYRFHLISYRRQCFSIDLLGRPAKSWEPGRRCVEKSPKNHNTKLMKIN